MSRSAYWRLETGANFELKTLVKICRLLEISLEDFFKGINIPSSKCQTKNPHIQTEFSSVSCKGFNSNIVIRISYIKNRISKIVYRLIPVILWFKRPFNLHANIICLIFTQSF